MGVFFTRALNMHLSPSTPLIVDAVNPGYCYSNLRRSFSLPMKIFDWVMERLLAFTTEEGGRQVVYAAIGGQDDDETRMRGAYISLSQVREPSEFVLSEEGARVQERIWVSANLICLDEYSGITYIIYAGGNH